MVNIVKFVMMVKVICDSVSMTKNWDSSAITNKYIIIVIKTRIVLEIAHIACEVRSRARVHIPRSI